MKSYFLRILSAGSLSFFLLWFGGCASNEEVKVINGAGATFPYPIYSQWAHKYHNLRDVRLNYQSIGSGGGIAQIKAKTVDFGATDAPLKSAELEDHGLLQFPMIVGGVVPVVNVEGISKGQIVLDAQVLTDIFLGNITKWNHEAIQALNPEIKLPEKDVTVVHRADGSGTTWIFTNYLNKISNAWHDAVGTGKAVAWPTGVGGKGNEGVANYVNRVDGAIGYVEYAYALQNNMNHIRLKNSDGNIVAPTIETFQAAAANADWKNTPGFSVVLTDQAGANSWPITGASFILVYKDQSDKKTASTVLSFFDWCFRHGAEMAQELHYVPIPMNVVEIIEQTWRDEIRGNGQAVWE
jgi:phosphate transport system substrate-binding protein